MHVIGSPRTCHNANLRCLSLGSNTFLASPSTKHEFCCLANALNNFPEKDKRLELCTLINLEKTDGLRLRTSRTFALQNETSDILAVTCTQGNINHVRFHVHRMSRCGCFAVTKSPKYSVMRTLCQRSRVRRRTIAHSLRDFLSSHLKNVFIITAAGVAFLLCVWLVQLRRRRCLMGKTPSHTRSGSHASRSETHRVGIDIDEFVPFEYPGLRHVMQAVSEVESAHGMGAGLAQGQINDSSSCGSVGSDAPDHTPPTTCKIIVWVRHGANHGC